MSDRWWTAAGVSLCVAILALAGCSEQPQQPASSEVTSGTQVDSWDGTKSIWVTTVDGRRIPCVMWWRGNAAGVSCDWSAK